MEKSKRLVKVISRVFRGTCITAIITPLVLAGCGHDKPLIRTKSETEIAVAAIKSEWVKLCELPVESESVNQVGALLKDYVDTAEALAICLERHNDFVEYLVPVIKKERGEK